MLHAGAIYINGLIHLGPLITVVARMAEGRQFSTTGGRMEKKHK
jgi:hypothetical protein